MKNFNLFTKRFITIMVLAFTFFMVLAAPTPVMAQTVSEGDKVVLGGNFRLRSNESVNGNLIVLGGTVVTEAGSFVNGDVILMGGTLEISGTVEGSINAIGGTLSLLDQAVVNGDINLNSVSLIRSPGAVITGTVNDNLFNLDGMNWGQNSNHFVPYEAPSPVRTWIDFVINILWGGLRVLAVSAFAALVVLLAQKPTERVTQSIVSQPIIASAFGLLTVIVAPALLVLLMITLVLIPVALIGLFLLGLAGLFGWVAIGYEVGMRIERSLKHNWAPAISAGVGTFILSLVASLFGVIPCVGWIIPVIISIVGLGGVMISRFGSMVYNSTDKTVLKQPSLETQNQAELVVEEKPETKSDLD